MTFTFQDLASNEMNMEFIKNLAKQLSHSPRRLACNSECYLKHFVIDHSVIALSSQVSCAPSFLELTVTH